MNRSFRIEFFTIFVTKTVILESVIFEHRKRVSARLFADNIDRIVTGLLE